MKIITRILIIFILCFSGTLSSQNERPISELLEVLSENHMGSISDVFSPNELLLLDNYFDQSNANENSVENLGLNFFGTENQSSAFGTIDEDDPGTFNIIADSPVPDFEGAGVYDPFDDVFYVIDDANNVWIVDPQTGVYVSAGMITPPMGETFTGLEFDPASGELYGLSTNGMGTTTLSTINLNTLSVMPIGITGLVLGIALAADNNGNLFALDIDTDLLYAINKITGVGNAVGNIGFDANFGAAMFRNAITGLVYLVAYNTAVNDSQLHILNLITGVAILVGVVIVAILAQMAWASFKLPLAATEDLDLDNFTIYPNPASDNLILKANSIIENLQVYSMLGQEIISQTIKNFSSEVDVSNLPSGNYIIKVYTENGTEVQKFIKL